MRRSRQRGAVAHLMVIATAISLSGIIYATAASTGGLALEERRLTGSDAALGVAEAGVAVARHEIENGGAAWSPVASAPGSHARATPLEREPLGQGWVTVSVERWTDASGEHAVVVATGTIPAPLVAGKGGTCSRRVEVALELSPAAPGHPRTTVVRGWKEL